MAAPVVLSWVTTVTTNRFEARLSANRSDKKRNRMRIPHPWNWNRSQLAEADRAFPLASRVLAMQQRPGMRQRDIHFHTTRLVKMT